MKITDLLKLKDILSNDSISSARITTNDNFAKLKHSIVGIIEALGMNNQEGDANIIIDKVSAKDIVANSISVNLGGPPYNFTVNSNGEVIAKSVDTQRLNTNRVSLNEDTSSDAFQAGEIRWTGSDFVGWDGNEWVSLTAGASGGEANTASNLPGDGTGIFKDKLGTDLRFKRIRSGSGINIDSTNPDELLITSTIVGESGISGFSGYSGFSGQSGFSGFSGQSGFSGFSGQSGFSGAVGTSGFSGGTGVSGFSGFSGISGFSGFSGFSGRSGFSGVSGFSGFSGASGFSGERGEQGLRGFDGETGFSGYSGYSGFSGFPGQPGMDGETGFSGYSGFSGFSGANGETILNSAFPGDTMRFVYEEGDGIETQGVSGWVATSNLFNNGIFVGVNNTEPELGVSFAVNGTSKLNDVTATNVTVANTLNTSNLTHFDVIDINALAIKLPSAGDDTLAPIAGYIRYDNTANLIFYGNGIAWEPLTTIGYLKKVAQNYIIVTGEGTPLENGTVLRDAVIAAKLLTPNGLPLSNTNRATVYIFNGVYDLGALNISIGQFVDIIGLGDKKATIIKSSVSPLFVENTNNYVVKSISLDGSSFSISHNIGQTDYGVWENVYFVSGQTTEGTIWAGNYSNIDAANVYYILNGDIVGKVSNSAFAGESCGFKNSGDVTISGEIINCTGLGGGLFGCAWDGNCIITGKIEGCTIYEGWGYSFGHSWRYNCEISGNITNCYAYNYSYDDGYSFGNIGWGASDTSMCTISGTILNCYLEGEYSRYVFGSNNRGSVTISGDIRKCSLIVKSDSTEGTFSFGSAGYGVMLITGYIADCTSQGGNSFGHGDNQCDVILDTWGIIENCTATYLGRNFIANNSYNQATTEIRGVIRNCTGTNRNFGYSSNYNVLISGIVKNCHNSGGNSFGMGDVVEISGLIDNCSQLYTTIGDEEAGFSGYGGFGYGYSSCTISGRILNCHAASDSYCFGFSQMGNVLISGLIEDCKSGDESFGITYDSGNVVITGSIINCICVGGQYGSIAGGSFGVAWNGDVNISGKIKNCTFLENGWGYNFGVGNNVDISGIIQNCKSKGMLSFGAWVNNNGLIQITGFIDNCESDQTSFGYGGNISGTVKNCKGTFLSFGSTTTTGKLINCTRLGGYGIHQGTIERCTFSGNHETPTLTLGTGAKVRYSTIYQGGPGECFDGTPSTIVSITHCQANKDILSSGNITNNISVPYNVIDSNITI
jgi:hypothetical protein